MATASIKIPRNEYTVALPRWQKARAVIAGSVRQFLRNVGELESDTTIKAARQADYEEGAVFYNFTSRTIDGMTGAIFQKEAEAVIPPAIDYIESRVNAGGLSLEQQVKGVVYEDILQGRFGLLVDMPRTTGNETIADEMDGMLSPGIFAYVTESIIDWRVEDGITTMVTLMEEYEYIDSDDQFSTRVGIRYRGLYLDENGEYTQEIYTEPKPGKGDKSATSETVEPRVNGERLNYIPFVFGGSKDNTADIDEPPSAPIVDLNVGHYRNSADNEESSFIVGQPTLGVDVGEDSIRNVQDANGGGFRFGSRAGIALAKGGRIYLVQAAENNLPLRNMEIKEKQAIQVGAQLIVPGQQITAESARIQKGADASVLSNIADNVSDAYEQCLQWIADWQGAAGDVEYRLNTEFFMGDMTAQDVTSWLAAINTGSLPATMFYSAMRKAGKTDMTDSEIKVALDEGEQNRVAL